MVTIKEIEDLANLARLELSKEEVERFKGDISSILEYVDSISELEIQSDTTGQNESNVFRDDEVTNKPDEYTEALLSAAPRRDGRYLKVQKILTQDE